MFLKRAWKKDLCDRAMTISPIHTSMAEGPFPLQRIHNFPLRGRGTPGLRQGHNAPTPREAHRSGAQLLGRGTKQSSGPRPWFGRTPYNAYNAAGQPRDMLTSIVSWSWRRAAAAGSVTVSRTRATSNALAAMAKTSQNEDRGVPRKRGAERETGSDMIEVRRRCRGGERGAGRGGGGAGYVVGASPYLHSIGMWTQNWP